jgi:hypothetical protein
MKKLLVPEKESSDDVNELIGIFNSIARLFDLEGNCCLRLSDLILPRQVPWT